MRFTEVRAPYCFDLSSGAKPATPFRWAKAIGDAPDNGTEQRVNVYRLKKAASLHLNR